MAHIYEMLNIVKCKLKYVIKDNKRTEYNKMLNHKYVIFLEQMIQEQVVYERNQLYVTLNCINIEANYCMYEQRNLKAQLTLTCVIHQKQ